MASRRFRDVDDAGRSGGSFSSFDVILLLVAVPEEWAKRMLLVECKQGDRTFSSACDGRDDMSRRVSLGASKSSEGPSMVVKL
jgi:hypothetical protein